jgi:hypothetical protein
MAGGATGGGRKAGRLGRGGAVLNFAQTRWYELSRAHKKAPGMFL